MKISKNYIQIIIILVILAALLALSKFKNWNSNPVSSNSKISYTQKHELSDATPDDTPIIKQVDIPQLSNANNNPLWTKINQDIVKDFKRGACPDLEDEKSIDGIFEGAKLRHYSDMKLSNNPDRDEKLKYIANSGFISKWEATSTFVNDHIFSTVVNWNSDCGGVHPNSGTYGLNYNLNSWKEASTTSKNPVKQIDFNDIFINYEKDKAAIEKIVLNKVLANYDKTNSDDSICIDTLQMTYDGRLKSSPDDNLGLDPFKYLLDAKGINVLSFDLPNLIAACEPPATHITFDSLKPYLKPPFLEMVK